MRPTPLFWKCKGRRVQDFLRQQHVEMTGDRAILGHRPMALGNHRNISFGPLGRVTSWELHVGCQDALRGGSEIVKRRGSCVDSFYDELLSGTESNPLYIPQAQNIPILQSIITITAIIISIDIIIIIAIVTMVTLIIHPQP